MNATFEALSKIFNQSEENAGKFFEKGNAAAGTRLRKNMSEITKLAKQIRNEVTEAKKAKA